MTDTEIERDQLKQSLTMIEEEVNRERMVLYGIFIVIFLEICNRNSVRVLYLFLFWSMMFIWFMVLLLGLLIKKQQEI